MSAKEITLEDNQEENARLKSDMNLYLSMFEKSHIAQVVIDTQFIIVNMNDAFCTIVDYPREKLHGMDFRDFKNKKMLDYLFDEGQGIADAIQLKKPVAGHAAWVASNGMHIVNRNIIPFLDNKGQIKDVYIIYDEVTEIENKMAEIERLKKQSDAIVQQNPMPILLWDKDLKVVASNKAFQDLTGYSKEQSERLTIKDFKYNAQSGQSVTDTMKTELASRGEAAIQFPSGERVVERYNIPLVDDKGKLANVLTIYNNITDQKMAIKDILGVSAEAEKGNLSVRTKEDNYKGDFFEIARGVNRTIDAVIGPMVEANTVLARMAVNDHSKGMEGNYQGIFAELKTSVNFVRDRVNHVADSLVRISEGDLTEAEVYRKIVKRSEADRLVPSFIRTFDALQALSNDANILAKAAVEGKLDTRADATKLQGDYRKIIEGVNATLDSVINPLNEAMLMANEFAKCNFTARFSENIHVEGDFIKFKKALNNTGIEVSRAVNLIQNQVMELASSAEEANASIEEVSSGAEQIAKNAVGVSTNAERGNEGITQVLRAMEDLNQTVTDVAQKAEKVSQLTEDANNLSVKGTGLAEQAERGMQSITISSAEVEKIIIDIKVEMEKIGKIVGLIRDLANQTNLLALNAAIEAARAGEAGRGFAVVATEVKSLAQESRASAENIADMIGTLQKKSIAAGEAVASSNREVKTGSEALSQTLRAFNDIAKSIEDISRNVVEVASISEEQAATVEEVTASVNEVHGMVQATAKDAMDAAAASEEASASIDQITKVVGGVNAIVDNVSKEMAKFKI